MVTAIGKDIALLINGLRLIISTNKVTSPPSIKKPILPTIVKGIIRRTILDLKGYRCNQLNQFDFFSLVSNQFTHGRQIYIPGGGIFK